MHFTPAQQTASMHQYHINDGLIDWVSDYRDLGIVFPRTSAGLITTTPLFPMHWRLFIYFDKYCLCVIHQAQNYIYMSLLLDLNYLAVNNFLI